MKTRQWVVMALVVALAGLALFGFGGVMAAPGGPEAQSGTVTGSVLATVYDDTFITTTTTYPDAVRTRYYNSYDLFATADFSTTGALTITLQFSADGENWVDGYYVSEGYVLPLSYSGTLTNSSGITDTTTSTFTTSISGASASYESTAVPYRIVLTSDGGDYLRNVPTVGWYMRPKIEASGAVTDGVELLIQAVLRNN